MSNTQRNFTIKSLFMIIIFVLPLLSSAQTAEQEMQTLQNKIDTLSKMLTKLSAEQNHSQDIKLKLVISDQDYSKQDKQRLLELRRKQVESRARIDAITMDIIKISKQLEDPRKRYALAKRMQTRRTPGIASEAKETKDTTADLDAVSARSIDLAAVKLVRQGKSLDQGRLLLIDQLSTEQVLTFYRKLPKEARYELYDIADEISTSDGIELSDARRSAIYFYLFTK